MPTQTQEDLISFAGIADRVSLYQAGRDAAVDLDATLDAIEADGERPVWISVVGRKEAHALLAAARRRLAAGENLPLFGIPFAVKDNIDVAGLATTAGCPEFSHRPTRSAAVVERLVAAGAIPVGKTNLDQFATGLSGTRSPYGVPACPFDPGAISGGSSSGSAVAVAKGLVAFSLGTDTAGSGRVPAGFNNIVGLKPSRGLISTRGIVPACRTLDCVSIFAHSVNDAFAVLGVCAAFDAQDPYSRKAPEALRGPAVPAGALRVGTLSAALLARCDDDVAARYSEAASALAADGAALIEIDYALLEEAASLLYAGPWVAERLTAIRDFAQTRPEAIHPVVRDIVLSGARYSAVDGFAAQYRLAEIARSAAAMWDGIDVLLVPTAPHHPTIAAMAERPVELNAELGLFTNFVNLLDMAALSIPAGWSEAGRPIGVTLIAPAYGDALLARVADRLHRADGAATIGVSSVPLARTRPLEIRNEPAPDVTLAVVGAHLTGQPLNGQLTSRGARLVRTARTAAGYSLYALPETAPPKPGLSRDGGAGRIEVELWAMAPCAFGAFVAEVPPPLGIGTLELDDGSSVKGFICEGHALRNARDITACGGWRRYLDPQS